VPRRSKTISRQNDASVRQNRLIPGVFPGDVEVAEAPQESAPGRVARRRGPGRRSGLRAGVRTWSPAARPLQPSRPRSDSRATAPAWDIVLAQASAPGWAEGAEGVNGLRRFPLCVTRQRRLPRPNRQVPRLPPPPAVDSAVERPEQARQGPVAQQRGPKQHPAPSEQRPSDRRGVGLSRSAMWWPAR
jgi:hypothetical protein